jgi:hypothetical protein
MTNAINAPRGEKTIRLTVVFFTNKLAENKGEQIPKHAWSGGRVIMQSNTAHGIKPGSDDGFFHDLLELPKAIGEVLANNGIVLHASTLSKLTPKSTRRARTVKPKSIALQP